MVEVITVGLRKAGGRQGWSHIPTQPLDPEHFLSCKVNPSAPLPTPITTRALTTCDCPSCIYTGTPAGRARKPQLSLFTRLCALPYLPQESTSLPGPGPPWADSRSGPTNDRGNKGGPSFHFFSQRPEKWNISCCISK